MKRNILFLLFLLCCFAIVFTGCTEDTKTERVCVKCGGVATTTLSGPADIMQKNGISISNCTPINGNIYSVYICDTCVGPVADIRPDP